MTRTTSGWPRNDFCSSRTRSSATPRTSWPDRCDRSWARSVEQISHERAALAKSVQDVALESLNNQGLIVDSLQISSVEDDTNYLRNLGRPESAQVEKAAAIAEANARQEASEKQAVADEVIAIAQQRLAIRRAELKEATDARQGRGRRRRTAGSGRTAAGHPPARRAGGHPPGRAQGAAAGHGGAPSRRRRQVSGGAGGRVVPGTSAGRGGGTSRGRHGGGGVTGGGRPGRGHGGPGEGGGVREVQRHGDTRPAGGGAAQDRARAGRPVHPTSRTSL